MSTARTLNPPLLEVKDLSVRFSSEAGVLHAVDRFSFSVDRGEILALVGESGSGKTVSVMSLMQLIYGSEMEISGSALWDQQRNLLTLPAGEIDRIRGREVGFLFQNPLNCLNPVMRIGHQIAEAPLHHGLIKKGEATEFAIGLLRRVGIKNPEKRHRDYPHQFSGGERQRVMIAIAMSCGPKLLICDEPTTSLDVTIEKMILQLLLDLRKSDNLSIIFITHDLNVAMGFADRVAVMYGGALMEIGSTYDIASQPLHPYTRALFAANLMSDEGNGRAEEEVPGEGWPEGCQFLSSTEARPFISRSMMMPISGSSTHFVNRFMLGSDEPKERS